MLNPAVSPHSVSSSPPRVPFVQLSRRVSLGRANLTVLRYQLPKMDLELLHNPLLPDQLSSTIPAICFKRKRRNHMSYSQSPDYDHSLPYFLALPEGCDRSGN